MPFQDIEEVSTSDLPRTPGTLEKTLRRIFVEDWGLKLLALAITLALWLAVTGQNTPVTIHANVLLNFIRPASLEISNDPPRSVDVLLTASRNRLNSLSLLDLVATVDISDQQPGERVLRLSEKARIELPDGVKIDSFRPGAIPIRLEPVVERQLLIEARLEDKPAGGYEIYGLHPTKSTVIVHGPIGHVNSLKTAPTETISVAGRKESFVASNVAIDIPDFKVDVEDPIVDVQIEIGELRAEKSFANVPVSAVQGTAVQQRTATVTILGPAGLVAQLQPGDIKIILDLKGETLEPRLDLPSTFQGKIVLKSVKPAQFSRVK